MVVSSLPHRLLLLPPSLSLLPPLLLLSPLLLLLLVLLLLLLQLLLLFWCCARSPADVALAMAAAAKRDCPRAVTRSIIELSHWV